MSAVEAPPVARRVRVGMPQLDAGGLSEGWLLRHAGALHWEAIGSQLQAASPDILGECGQRLYPTFVAVRARYQLPLVAVIEDDVLETAIEVVPCGRACAHGRFVAGVRGNRLELELLSTFARREPDGALKMALPAARLAARWQAVETDSPLAGLARAARRGEPLVDDLCGPALDTGAPPLGRTTYDPSPYADYNGAGLLYFASYVTIADTAERRLVTSLGLAPPGAPDWALAASPIQRVVFYCGNLPLGQSVLAELLACERERDSVRTRVRLRRSSDGATMADVVTRKQLVRR